MPVQDVAALERLLDLVSRLDEVSRLVEEIRPDVERAMAAARDGEAAGADITSTRKPRPYPTRSPA